MSMSCMCQSSVLQLWPGPGRLAQQPEFVIREQLVGHHGVGPQHPKFDLDPPKMRFLR